MVLSKSDTVLQRVTVRGVVQGVGFRPFVFNLAERYSLVGWVLNNSSGVEIEVEGSPDQVAAFVTALRAEAPPLARVESLDARPGAPQGYDRFEIRHSERQAGRYQLISPDIATCADCLRELFDPTDRRFRYPFINCTNCGPRFTIIADIPYDRPSTTMRIFPMCPDCQREYDDPRDRRFHAQPNACPVCGPRLEWVDGYRSQVVSVSPKSEDLVVKGLKTEGPETEGQEPETGEVMARAARMLRRGGILAIKGLGGFHLACDATDVQAVCTLRERKRRPHKPFAVMMSTLDEVKRHCRVSPEEEALLTSPQCPIVLLPWLPASTVVQAVAPGYRTLGVMLPYTPLHQLLLHDMGRPLVMTSGNLTEEPIAAENDEALRRLGQLADAFVLHNRGIQARYDDSVWFVPGVSSRLGMEAGTLGSGAALAQPIRRARGYAPFPVRLPFKAGQVLACGAEIKNTFCLTRDEYAFLSQHIGDMENLETLEHFERTIELYKQLFRVEPEIVAYDLHPDYMATRYALEQIETYGLPPVPVQHHHAHLAACLADNGWRETDGAVIGVILDGTGYGEDGDIWGGEWLAGDYRGYERVAHLEYLPLPGGDAATRNPWRIAVSYLHTLLGRIPEGVLLQGVEAVRVEWVRRQIERRLNCPLTSSMGRLFDAVSALLGICTETTYEAQAAIELEMAANEQIDESAGHRSGKAYRFRVEKASGQEVVRLRELFEALVADRVRGVSVGEMSRRFHQTVAQMIVAVCERVAAERDLRVVALSGGCFQNRLLLASAVPALQEAGFRVLTHGQVPCNDGGLSLGQAAIACSAVR